MGTSRGAGGNGPYVSKSDQTRVLFSVDITCTVSHSYIKSPDIAAVKGEGNVSNKCGFNTVQSTCDIIRVECLNLEIVFKVAFFSVLRVTVVPI